MTDQSPEEAAQATLPISLGGPPSSGQAPQAGSSVSGAWRPTTTEAAGPSVEPEPTGPTSSVSVDPQSVSPDESWGLCRLLAPSGLPGLGGTDLGFSVLSPVHDRLVILFGDTWTQATDTCFFPREWSDDLQATLPVTRPASLSAGAPTPDAANACADLRITTEDPEDATSWRPIRLFADASSREPDNLLDTTFLRTPVTGFSDGELMYGVFLRDDPVRCSTSEDCPDDASCSLERDFPEFPLGACEATVDVQDTSPTFCLYPSACSDGSACVALGRGVCLASAPYTIATEGGPVSPPWYQEDPRRALYSNVYIGAALWPERPEDYAVGYRFATNKFVNAVARTVSFFDPEDPSRNDYRKGHHTLLMWGRPSFAANRGAQSPLYLLYQPLEGLRDPEGGLAWAPRFFAGYDPTTGKPRWSSRESDALPVYGVSETVEMLDGQPLASEPDFELVNHAAMTYVEALGRWVMFYGGSVPEWMLQDRATGELYETVYRQPVPGALHMRTAVHPWGRATLQSSLDEAWSSPQPVLDRAALSEFLTCDDPAAASSTGCTVPRDPATLVNEIIDWALEIAPGQWDVTASICMLGNVVMSYLFNLEGSDAPHLYGANIIDEWTQDVSDSLPDLEPGERAVEIYWNVSTWNPYQVILLKTQLRARVR